MIYTFKAVIDGGERRLLKAYTDVEKGSFIIPQKIIENRRYVSQVDISRRQEQGFSEFLFCVGNIILHIFGAFRVISRVFEEHCLHRIETRQQRFNGE